MKERQRHRRIHTHTQFYRDTDTATMMYWPKRRNAHDNQKPRETQKKQTKIEHISNSFILTHRRVHRDNGRCENTHTYTQRDTKHNRQRMANRRRHLQTSQYVISTHFNQTMRWRNTSCTQQRHFQSKTMYRNGRKCGNKPTETSAAKHTSMRFRSMYLTWKNLNRHRIRRKPAAAYRGFSLPPGFWRAHS